MTSSSILIPFFSSIEHLQEIATKRSITPSLVDAKQQDWIQQLTKSSSTLIIGIENNRYRINITDSINSVKSIDAKTFSNIFYFDPDYIDYKNLTCKICDTNQFGTRFKLERHCTADKHVNNMKIHGYEVTNQNDKQKFFNSLICEVCDPYKSYLCQSALDKHLKSKKHLKISDNGGYELQSKQIRQNLESLGFTILDEHILVFGTINIKCKENHIIKIFASVAKKKGTSYCCECVEQYGYTYQPRVKARKSLEDVKEAGNKLGLILLSDEYNLSTDKLGWECPFGHICYITYAKVQQGRGCKECFCKRITTPEEEIIRLASINGFTIINFVGKYVGRRGYARVKCKLGHITIKSVNCIWNGNGCKDCLVESKRKSIEEVRAEALKIGLELVSTEYKRNSDRLELKCILNKHTIFKSYQKIKSSFGCTKCCSSKGQTLIRNILTEMKIPFEEEVRIIPSHMKYKFDFICFVNGEYIAIEYDGIQHFEIECFNRSDEEFIKARERDIFKQNCVVSNGHRIIRIDYTVEDDEIKSHLLKAFEGSNKIYYSTPELYEWL